MSPKGRITKKEMKEDKLVTFAFQVVELLQKYKNQALVGAGVTVVLAVMIYFFLASRANEASQAAALFSRVNFELKAVNNQQGIAELEMIIRRFPGTESSGKALFLLADLYFQANDLQKAQDTFQKYLLEEKDPLLRASAQAGIAQCYLQMGDFSLAGEGFMKAAGQAEFLKKDYLFNAAWVLSKTEQKQKAKQIYKQVIEEFPGSSQAQKSKLALAEMS